jgi:5-methylcytosine-specific restriction protein A
MAAMMPWRQCPVGGCSGLTRGGGRCPKHSKQKKAEYQANRSKEFKHLYSHRWNEYSKGRRRRFPLCAECLRQGKTTPAQVTDHIQAHKGSYQLFWNYSNHQSLCKECHDKKTYDEGAFGKPPRGGHPDP